MGGISIGNFGYARKFSWNLAALIPERHVRLITFFPASNFTFSIRPVKKVGRREESLSGKAILLLFVFSASATMAAPSSRSRILDTTSIRKTYMEGDFEQAIEELEQALKRGGPFSHQDSVFMFKHLGVMHTATYETREKGRYYMMQLLTVEPTARILDMYASDMIYMIFKNIQAEFQANQGKLLVDYADTVKTLAAEQPPEKKKERRSKAWIGWTVGALAAAGGVALTMHLLDEPLPKEYIGE